MAENIIWVQGRSCPYTKKEALWQTRYTEGCIGALENAGHTVKKVGGAWRGFRMGHIQQTFEKMPKANVVIVDAHGNVDPRTGKPYIVSGDKDTYGYDDIYNEVFYRALALFSQNKPLNVFMLTCGAGHSHGNEITFLPPGSTLVTIAEERGTYSYAPKPQFLKIAPSPNKPFAETLFLNLLSKGFYQRCPYYPRLSVSARKRQNKKSWDIWGLAGQELSGRHHPVFDPTFQNEVTTYLADHLSANLVVEALERLKAYKRILDPTVVLHAERPRGIDKKFLVQDARATKLLGPMCAVAYCANRRDIGAFQMSLR